ncbi:hypothetical protein JQ543_13725 [Bradyrhizobium diazoefficiens]|nr:hypothetical protein [Bradyrhizobium diazoefficiens]MBR0848807.1 hypothetical protein [Bradyrhizobium diazoefficiens]
MTDADELSSIADRLAQMKKRFIEGNTELFLRSEDQSEFTALVTEAKSIMGSSLGPANDFTFQMLDAVREGTGGFFGGPSPHCVETVEALLRGAVRHIERKARTPAITQSKPNYVDMPRIIQIEALRSQQWDFAKLGQLCRELNTAHQGDSHYATAMLVRAITDHVPPLFGQSSFAQVAANYSGTTSFKKSMSHLNQSLRNIADAILHEQIRRREVLPSPQQVDFRQDLDRLLAEIVRITPSP